MIQPTQEKINVASIHTIELNSLVEMAKNMYAIFRTSELKFRFGYLQEIERVNVQYTKMTDRNDLRKALITFFIGTGDSNDEAERTTEVYL